MNSGIYVEGAGRPVLARGLGARAAPGWWVFPRSSWKLGTWGTYDPNDYMKKPQKNIRTFPPDQQPSFLMNVLSGALNPRPVNHILNKVNYNRMLNIVLFCTSSFFGSIDFTMLLDVSYVRANTSLRILLP